MNHRRVRCWHSWVGAWGSADAELPDNTVTWYIRWHWLWQKAGLGISERAAMIKNKNSTFKSWGNSSKHRHGHCASWPIQIIAMVMGAIMHTEVRDKLKMAWHSPCLPLKFQQRESEGCGLQRIKDTILKRICFQHQGNVLKLVPASKVLGLKTERKWTTVLGS